jgi:Family of unknown function (DUF5681)
VGDRSEASQYEVGYAKPPRETSFRPGQSGNRKGRPPGAKNFATALEEELRVTVPVTENGRRRKLQKRQVIAKQLVNRAAEGDPKFMPLLLNEMRAREHPADALGGHVFGGPEDDPLIESIIERIRAAEAPSFSSVPRQDAFAAAGDSRQLKLPLEPDEQSSSEGAS